MLLFFVDQVNSSGAVIKEGQTLAAKATEGLHYLILHDNTVENYRNLNGIFFKKQKQISVNYDHADCFNFPKIFFCYCIQVK